MSLIENGLPRFNSCPVPNDFELEDAWEINERFPAPEFNIDAPLLRPAVSPETDFILADGKPRYIVEDQPILGSGGYSSLHRGWDRRLEKYVAVKKGDIYGWLDEDQSLRLLELEAKTMAKINHPGIPEIYNYSTITTSNKKKVPVIIMALINGESLYDRLDNENDELLSLGKVLKIIFQTASTLDYIDKMGLNHGDLKPANILLVKPHIKIVDFGNSNWANPEGTEACSPGYTAPEFFSDRVSVRSDEYSLAATTYNLLFHRSPSENSEKLLKSIPRAKSCYPFTKLVRRDINRVLSRGLAEKPEDRFDSCTEFANAFSVALGRKV